MFKFFKKSEPFRLVAPISGILTPLEDVHDEVFSKKIMGDGFAIEPTDNVIYAPISGKIESLPDSLHAVGISSEDGHQVLVHIGIDTVNLNGKGFKSFVKQGQKVVAGTKLLSFDSGIIEEAELEKTTMVIYLKGFNDGETLKSNFGKQIKEGEILIS